MDRSQQTNAKTWASMLMPRTELSSLFFAAVIRDTRGVILKPDERFNHFPASPLCAVTWIHEGFLHLADEAGNIDAKPLPHTFVTGPCSSPLVSWSAGPLYAMTVGVYPDALRRLTGVEAGIIRNRTVALNEVFDGDLLDLFESVSKVEELEPAFDTLQDNLSTRWRSTRPTGAFAAWRLADWARSLAARAALSETGGSARQIQRKIKSWTAHSLRELRVYGRIGKLCRSRDMAQASSLAQIAAEAGYSDQSHMGRDVRRITGVSTRGSGGSSRRIGDIGFTDCSPAAPQKPPFRPLRLSIADIGLGETVGPLSTLLSRAQCPLAGPQTPHFGRTSRCEILNFASGPNVDVNIFALAFFVAISGSQYVRTTEPFVWRTQRTIA